MNFYEMMTGQKFNTTAIYSNRILDKSKVEAEIGLMEIGCDNIEFFSSFNTLVSKGYLRIVYGDHGPYIEFTKQQIIWSEWECVRKGMGYYDMWYPVDGSNILLYNQRSSVSNLPNPPKGGFYGNRSEGYADYRPGKNYISPWDLKI